MKPNSAFPFLVSLPTSLRAITGALALGLLMATPADAAGAGGNPLEAERWKTRPVVVVVPISDSPLLQKLESALQQTATREAFIDREMVLYTVVAGVGRRNAQPLAPAQTRALLAALKLDPHGPPTFMLVGKDGGVKLTEGADVRLDDVFASIDRMPMRRTSAIQPR